MTTTMTAVEFSAFLVLATAMSFTPGPNTTMAAAMGANWGLKPAMRFVWGVPIGWGALLLLCASGVGALVMAAPALKGAIKAVGIVYLVWLAYKLSRSGQLAETKNGHLLGFWQAVGLQFVNVKAWLLALAIVAGWIVGFQDPWHVSLLCCRSCFSTPSPATCSMPQSARCCAAGWPRGSVCFGSTARWH